jgi:hypothetical protein
MPVIPAQIAPRVHAFRQPDRLSTGGAVVIQAGIARALETALAVIVIARNHIATALLPPASLATTALIAY